MIQKLRLPNSSLFRYKNQTESLPSSFFTLSFSASTNQLTMAMGRPFSSRHNYSVSPLLALLLVVALFANSSTSATTTNTRYIIPVAKDTAGLKYYTSFFLGTPPVRQYLTVDISAPYNWVNGNLSGYSNSSTYHSIDCFPECDSYIPLEIAGCVSCSGPASPACNNRQCAASISSPTAPGFTLAPVVTDNITIYQLDPNTQTTNPYPSFSSLKKASIPRFFIASTNSTQVFKGLSQYTKGVLRPTSLDSYIDRTFGASRLVAMCLPSSSSVLNGAFYFGGGPYIFPPSKANLSNIIVYTETDYLHDSNQTMFDRPYGSYYYIKITSTKIDGSAVPFNLSLLDTDVGGNGRSRLSTIDHYTLLHSEIYKPFVALFVLKAKAMNITRVSSVSPFGACFSSKTIHYNAKSGRGLPVIDLMFPGKSASWKIYGSNSMVKVSQDVECLAFVEDKRTSNPRYVPSITVGSKQMEDTLVEFDSNVNRIGVTSSLLKLGTSCSQFKGM